MLLPILLLLCESGTAGTPTLTRTACSSRRPLSRGIQRAGYPLRFAVHPARGYERGRARLTRVQAARRRTFEPGQGVIIRNLANATKFNGRTGVVKKTTAKGVLVEVSDHPKPLLIAPNKLLKCQRWLDKDSHELDPRTEYPPPPDYFRVIYSAVTLKPGLSTPVRPPPPRTSNAPPERFWVAQLAKDGEPLDMFFTAYNKLTVQGQAQCGGLGRDMRERFTETLSLLPTLLPRGTLVGARAPKGGPHVASLEAFLSGLLSKDCAIPEVRLEGPSSGLTAPTDNECPRLRQLRGLYDTETLEEYPDIEGVLPDPSILIPGRSGELGGGDQARGYPPMKGRKVSASRGGEEGEISVGVGIGAGEPQWTAILDDIRAHYLYGLPLPYGLTEDAVEKMHRHRLSILSRQLSDTEYRKLTCGPFLYTMVQEMADVLYYGLKRNITVYSVDETVMNGLIAAFAKKLRTGWPAPASHLVVEVARDSRVENGAIGETHQVRVLLNNKEVRLEKDAAWVSWTTFIGKIAEVVLRPEDYGEACRYIDPKEAKAALKAQRDSERRFEEEPTTRETPDQSMLRAWLKKADVPQLYVNFLSAGVHNVQAARYVVLTSMAKFADDNGLPAGDVVKLLHFAKREAQDMERMEKALKSAEKKNSEADIAIVEADPTSTSLPAAGGGSSYYDTDSVDYLDYEDTHDEDSSEEEQQAK